jgi:hypothetical protein
VRTILATVIASCSIHAALMLALAGMLGAG